MEGGEALDCIRHEPPETRSLGKNAWAEARREPGQRPQEAGGRAQTWAQNFAFSSRQQTRTKSLVEVTMCARMSEPLASTYW